MHSSTFPKLSSDSLRGLIQFVIIASHLSYIHPDVWLLVLSNKLASSVVGLFFFISGFGLASSFITKGKGYLKGFARLRVWSTLKPMLYLSIVYLLIMLIIEGGGIDDIYLSPYKLFRHGETPLPNSWFVYMLVYMYLAFYASFRYLAPSRALVLLAAFSVISIPILYKLSYERHWWVTNLAFLSGCIYAYYEREIYALTRRWYVLLFMLLMVLAIVATGVELLLPLCYLLIPIFIVSLLHRIGYTGWVTSKRGKGLKSVMYFFSGISYELYLVHGVIINLLYRYKDYVLAYCLAVVVVSVAVAYLYQKALQYQGAKVICGKSL